MKKLLIFLMVAIPLVIILIVNLTVNAVIGSVSISVERIVLDQTDITATIDDLVTLKATIYPENATNKEIFWTSDNEEVAKVDLNGNVTFVGFGNGYITATTADGYKTARCYFYVTDTKVHQVILSAPNSELHIGKTMQLTSQVLPEEALNKTVYFTSDNPQIASVDPTGLVSGVSVGRATITATTADGNYTDFVTISIINPVERLELNTFQAVTGDSTYRIGYTIYPENATNKTVIFEVDDEDIAQVQAGGVVTFKKAGQVNVKLTTVDGGFTQTMKIIYTEGYAYDLTLDYNSINAKLGDSAIYLSYTTRPSNLKSEVTFMSDNEDVAYVTETGYLSFEGGGSTIIRVRVKTSEDAYIEQQISVFVESPATGIVIDDVTTGQNTWQLNPKSYPANSTNDKFFYHSNDTHMAVVDENGLVTFFKPGQVTISIFANEDFGNVSKEVKVFYTGGRAESFDLNSKEIIMQNGDVASLNYTILPQNTTIKDVKIAISSSTSANANSPSDQVVEILQDGTIMAVGGGEAILEVSLELYDGSIAKYQCKVNVAKAAQDIEIILDLEQDEEGVYVTSENVLAFSAKLLPLDTTNKDITWSIDEKSMGVINGGVFSFNQVGTVTLTATSQGISKSVRIRYTGSYPESAEVGKLDGNQILPMPNSIMYGDTFEVALKSIFPSNTPNKNITLKVTNQSLGGNVLEIDGKTVKAIGGGKATLMVYVSTWFTSFDITVERLAESITVTPMNTQTTKSRVDLMASVLPNDTTDKTIEFVVDNPEIAYIDGMTLVFRQNGIATITATSRSNPEVKVTFTIQKVEKEPTIININTSSAQMLRGDTSVIDCTSIEGFASQSLSIISQTSANVVTINANIISASALGSAVIEVKVLNSAGETILTKQIAFTVVELVQDILFNDELLYNDEYVTANEELELNFTVLPETVENKELTFKIVQMFTTSGMAANIAYINDGKIIFTQAGTALLRVTSADGNKTKDFALRYTGGDAIDAQINLADEVMLEVGESVNVEVTKWIPADTKLKTFNLRAINNLNIISITGNTITALQGGECKVIVELSGGITKQISVKVSKKVSDIQIAETQILTSKSRVTINATAIPANATNKTLAFTLNSTDIATIEGNEVIFAKAGTVVVTISTTDGSNISKTITITSTMGKLSQIDINVTEKVINKNETFSLRVTNLYPFDAEDREVLISIIEEEGQNVVEYSNNIVRGLSGGSAIIRFYSKSNPEIYADCKIKVVVDVTDFNINFDNTFDIYQQALCTSRQEVNFTSEVIPADASAQDMQVLVSNPSIASVEEGKIIFNSTGIVTITFKLGQIVKQFTFNYMGNNLTQAELDTTGFSGNTLNLIAGDSKQLKLKSFIPSDNQNVEIMLEIIRETRIDPSKPVISYQNGTITALNGGTVTFSLRANGVDLKQWTVVVTRDAESIEVENDTIYISQNTYILRPTVLPSDANDKTLIYTSSNETIAVVRADGTVEFKRMGRVEITITLKNMPRISKTVVVEYTRELKAITFNEVQSEQYVGSAISLIVTPSPINAEDFDYTISVSNPDIATLSKYVDASGNISHILQGRKIGSVTVTATATSNSEITVSKTFTFIKQITDISLTLDRSGDSNGLVNYRVFGDKFVRNDRIVNTFEMTYNTKTNPQDQPIENGDLEWSSSDETIAKVDQYGVVSFLGTGRVRITVSTKRKFEGASVKSDYYDFIVVDGINAFNVQEYIFAHNHLNKQNENAKSSQGAIILHNDISFDNNAFADSIVLTYNLYGNGHSINMNALKGYHKMIIKTNDVVIDGAVLTGIAFSENASLSELEGKGYTLWIDRAENVLVYNTIIENCHTCVRLDSAEATFDGCLIRNAFVAGILLARHNAGNDPSSKISVCTVKNTSITRCLLGCIFFDEDKSRDVSGQSIAYIKENVSLYNWITLEELEAGTASYLQNSLPSGVTGLIPPSEIAGLVKDAVRQQFRTNYMYSYNGGEYYLLGVLNIKQITAVNFNSNGKVDQGGATRRYATATLKASYAVVTLECEIHSLTNTNPFIKPGDTPDIATIRQNIRF